METDLDIMHTHYHLMCEICELSQESEMHVRNGNLKESLRCKREQMSKLLLCLQLPATENTTVRKQQIVDMYCTVEKDVIRTCITIGEEKSRKIPAPRSKLERSRGVIWYK